VGRGRGRGEVWRVGAWGGWCDGEGWGLGGVGVMVRGGGLGGWCDGEGCGLGGLV
jgi:hypothetical protein